MRAFVNLRRMIASHKGLARRLNALEQKYDGQFAEVFEKIRELMDESDARALESIVDWNGGKIFENPPILR